VQPTSPDQGLPSSLAQQRLAKHGPNKIGQAQKTPWYLKLLAEFKDLMIVLLIAAAIIAILNDELIDGFVILAIVIFNALISFYQQFKAEKALESLQKLVSPQAKVLRDGEVTVIDSEHLVPGDIVLLEAGDRIPADGAVICS